MNTPAASKPRRSDDQRTVAVLIDADNAQPAVIDGLLAEVAKYGVASVRRIYGDFTSQRLQGWKQVLLEHSIQPVQQFAYTSGKNATDSSLIIDAMDLMYSGRFDAFCLVSSDSDFTRLAQRLREQGLTVYGFGERKTPDPFVQACDKFIYTEVLRPPSPAAAKGAAAKKAKPAATKKGAAGSGASTAAAAVAQAQVTAAATVAATGADAVAGPAPAPIGATSGAAAGHEPASAARPTVPMALIHQAIEQAEEEGGWAHLGNVGNYLGKIRPDFDARLYGHRKLSDLIRAFPREFDLQERADADGSSKSLYVRSLV